MTRWMLLSIALVACKGSSKPLVDTLPGEWEELCMIEDESTSGCRSKSTDGLYIVFEAGGSVVSGAVTGTSMTGRWTLTGDELALNFEGGGLQIVEKYRAHVADGRLVLWRPNANAGSVYGRRGATFEAADTMEATGKPIAHVLGGIRYTLGVPAGYRLARDDHRRQEWAPPKDGFVVKLTVSPRVQHEVAGKSVTPPCNDYDYGGVSGSSATIDGVERDTSIGLSICLDGTELAFSCSTEHTRGYLEKSEAKAALALCKSLEIAH